MKKDIFIAAIVFLLFICCILGYLLFVKNLKLKALKERDTALCEKILFQTKTFGESELSPNLELIDAMRQKTKLSNVLNGKSKLVFRFTDSNIKASTFILPALKNLSQKIGVNNILLWTTSSKSFDTQSFSQINELGYPFFEISKKLLNSEIESKDVPYFFVVNSQDKVLFIFLPDKKLEDLTLQYFSQVVDYFKSTGQLNSIILFKKTEVDLGKLNSGKKYAVDFPFENKMDKPLVIYDVKTSCGCTVAAWEKNPLKPNATSKIRVEYNAESRGYFSKSIRVSSNAENGVIELVIKGIVR
jgi:hypothetical protein